MEFLKTHKRRTLLSETVYILLNVGLAGTVLAIVVATGTPWLALAFVILSKWRVLAVRPRYWFAHIESNAVDTIVSVGLVILMYLAAQNIIVQLLIAVLYACWLLLLKPATKRNAVAMQAATSIIVGTAALTSVSYEWPSSLYVILMWIIGYSAARHVLMAYSEEDVRFLSLIWGFVFAQIGWVTFHWTIAYSLPYAAGIKLPQVTIILLAMSFLAERVYNSYHRYQRVRTNDIVLPTLFSLGIIVVLLVFFNAATIGSS